MVRRPAVTSTQIAREEPVNLTTVAQDIGQMTNLAVTRANARLDGTDVTKRELVVPPHLVVRGTTAPPIDTSSPGRR
jgi:DNA-binding LacI/PurR family transcriptional regulator